MKHLRSLWVVWFLVLCTITLNAENTHYGDYTTPGVITPDLVIIGGNLDLKESFTVEGDLKIIGGKINIASDNALTRTVDLYVYGDLIVTNTDTAGELDASIYIPTGHLIVIGEIFTRSRRGGAWINTGYGIEAGRMETSGYGDAFILTHSGSIEVGEDIVTKSDDLAYIQAGNHALDSGCSIRAASITTYGQGTNAAYVEADGSITVRDAIVTNAVYWDVAESGNAYVKAATYSNGGIEAGSIITNGFGDAYIQVGSTTNGKFGYLRVGNDVVTTSSHGKGYVTVEEGYIKASNIATNAYKDAYVASKANIEVCGDIITKSVGVGAGVKDANIRSTDGSIIAKSLSTNAGRDAGVSAYKNVDIREAIVANSLESGNANIFVQTGNLCAARITLKSNAGVSDIVSNGVDVKGVISTNSLQNSALMSVGGGKLKAGSIFTYAPNGSAYVLVNGNIEVEDIIKTNGFGGDAYVVSLGSIAARAIMTEGDTSAQVTAVDSLNVVEDISTYASNGHAYVESTNGSIDAQKISTSAPANKDDYIKAAAGSARFIFVPTLNDAAITIKDAELSFDRDHEWNTKMTLQGTCMIDGNGHLLTFGESGSFVISSGATLLLKNITLNKVGGEIIKCVDATATFSVCDVVMTQTANTTFANGKIEVIGDFLIKGPGTQFSYTSNEVSTIHQDARLAFDRGVTVRYASAGASNIAMVDETSRLEFDGATLDAIQSLRLTKGTLVLDHGVTFNIAAAKTVSFGNGSIANNLEFDYLVGCKFSKTGSGSIENKNI